MSLIKRDHFYKIDLWVVAMERNTK